MIRPNNLLAWSRSSSGLCSAGPSRFQTKREPFIGRDHLGAHQQAGDEAIEFLDEHGVIAQGMQLLLKLLTAMRSTGHRRSCLETYLHATKASRNGDPRLRR